MWQREARTDRQLRVAGGQLGFGDEEGLVVAGSGIVGFVVGDLGDAENGGGGKCGGGRRVVKSWSLEVFAQQ